MNILVVAVTYNSPEYALSFMGACDQAATLAHDAVIEVLLVDNSEDHEHHSRLNSAAENCTGCVARFLPSSANLGYFGGFNYGISCANLPVDSYDFILISNVDVQYDLSFFSKLIALRLDNNVGVIAPSIISHRSGVDKNPKIISRLSIKEVRFYKFLFSSKIIFYIYSLLSILKSKFKKFFFSKLNSNVKHFGSNIYAPHGSVIIFTQRYVIKKASFDYPMFLFGEEVFVAEEARRSGLLILYRKDIVVYDEEHASTGKLINSELSQYHYQSICYLADRYFS